MKHLTIDQVYSLLQATANDRNRLMLQIAYEHGMRVSEVIALTPDRVERGYLKTRPGKDGKPTIQKLKPQTLELWEQAISNLAKDSRVFPFTRQWASTIFHRSCNAAGIALALHQGIHSLRHSIAHHLLDAGAPLPVVQQQLGHVSLASTGQYLIPDDSTVDAWRSKILR